MFDKQHACCGDRKQQACKSNAAGSAACTASWYISKGCKSTAAGLGHWQDSLDRGHGLCFQSSSWRQGADHVALLLPAACCCALLS
jgi:hypothetical protein